MEDLKKYFSETKGTGVMSTADEEGRVDSALFTPGLVIDKDQIAFVMLDRLIHRNLRSNPYAMFLFLEDQQERQR